MARAARDDTLESYEAAWRSSEIGRDLKRVRNVKPLWSRFGTLAGVALGGLDMWANQLFGASPFSTLRHGKPDSATLQPASACRRIVYPKPDGVLTFDRLSSVSCRTPTTRRTSPCICASPTRSMQKASEHDVFGGPSARYCPAGVYEWVEEGDEPRFVINAQNCVHCKTCDIKDPNQNITWVPPQGGEGPVYLNM